MVQCGGVSIMATVSNDTNDGLGTMVSSYYSTVIDAGGALSIKSNGLNGTAQALNGDLSAISGTTLVQNALAAPGTNQFRLRVYIDPTAWNTPTTGGHIINVQIATAVLTYIRLEYNRASGGNTQVFVRSFGPSASSFTVGPVNVSNALHCIEFATTRESVMAAADGTLELWIDGVSQGSVSNVQNFANYNAINSRQILISSADTAPSGEIIIDEMIIDDAISTALCVGNFGVTRSSLGRPQHALAVSADGKYVFIACEDTGGDQHIVRVSRPPVGGGGTTTLTVLSPSMAVSCGVIPTSNPDRMYFIGDEVVRHSIASGNTNIDPNSSPYTYAGRANPANPDNVMIADYYNGAVYETDNGGTSWTVIGAAIDEPFAIDVNFGGDVADNEIMLAIKTGGNNVIFWSPNNRASQTDEATVMIQGGGDVAGIDMT